MKHSITSLSETRELARTVIADLRVLPQQPSATVFGLSGELGSGKTAFVREFVAEAGGPAHVTSPTFVLIQQFPLSGQLPFKRVVHIDAYRIQEADELSLLSFEEMIADPTNLIFIEWPQQVQALLPANTYTIEFQLHADGTRTISIPKIGR